MRASRKETEVMTTEEVKDMREALEWIHERALSEGNAIDPLRLKMALATIEASAREVLQKYPTSKPDTSGAEPNWRDDCC
jgi:hypothetical protein